MAERRNPLKLNGLQLRTLTLLQELGRLEDFSRPAEEPGHRLIARIPHPHGDHFHLGPNVVLARDASGLGNESAWIALERKGLIKSMYPAACLLTPEGQAYDTGLGNEILHKAQH
jgi:hypothetical protein